MQTGHVTWQNCDEEFMRKSILIVHVHTDLTLTSYIRDIICTSVYTELKTWIYVTLFFDILKVIIYIIFISNKLNSYNNSTLIAALRLNFQGKIKKRSICWHLRFSRNIFQACANPLTKLHLFLIWIGLLAMWQYPCMILVIDKKTYSFVIFTFFNMYVTSTIWINNEPDICRAKLFS